MHVCIITHVHVMERKKNIYNIIIKYFFANFSLFLSLFYGYQSRKELNYKELKDYIILFKLHLNRQIHK